jgi:hypothetical protein
MPVGLIKFVIVQYTDLMYVLEEHLGHIIISTTVVLMRSQFKAHQPVRFLQDTALAANIAAWAIWLAVHHMQLSQVAAARATQLTQ